MKSKIITVVLFTLITSVCNAQSEYTAMKLVEKYGRAVVLIETRNAEKGTIGQGSGFLVSSSGVIVTNYHVIAGAYPGIVKLTNGDIYDNIDIVDVDRRKDIAIIKIKGFELPIVELGNSDSSKIGENVFVIGNPMGLENTISDGLLSGIRDSGDGFSFFQVSVPISPGSSGSPIFNSKGKVIGIATSTLKEGQNLNFSIPINYARGLIKEEITMNLKDLTGNVSEKLSSGISTLADPNENTKLFLQNFIKCIWQYLTADDAINAGGYATITPHLQKFKPEKYFIDMNVYNAKEAIDNLKMKVRDMHCENYMIEEIFNTFILGIQNESDAIDIITLGLENKDAFNNPSPDGNTLTKGKSKLSNSMTDFFSELDTLKSFISQKYPDLLEKLPPCLVLPPQDPAQPLAGFYYARGRSDCIVILFPVSESPSDGKLFKAGDILLGVGDINFKDIADYDSFIRTKKPGDIVSFRVNRMKEEVNVEIKLGKRN